MGPSSPEYWCQTLGQQTLEWAVQPLDGGTLCSQSGYPAANGALTLDSEGGAGYYAPNGSKEVVSVATDSTLVASPLSPCHPQSVLIDSVSSCVRYGLAGLVLTVFLHWLPIPLPGDGCGRSSLTAAGEGELRRADIGLSVQGSEGDGGRGQLACGGAGGSTCCMLGFQ